ncbi:MAG: NAD(P)/FAD-dependent oxidoreductase [Thermodesulfobacteriota bacterium]
MKDARDQAPDMVIVGAGPAGLAAGIAAAGKGMKALVLEKGAMAGPLPRGEGVNRHPLLDEYLGADFWENQCHRMDGSLEFHSPGDAKQTFLRGKREIYFFEWRRFMERLVRTAESSGVSIRYNSRVIGPLVNNERICTGVRYREESGAVREVHGKAVLACDGHKSVMGKHYGVDYERLNCAMVKCIAGNANIDAAANPALRFFLIGNGDLSYAPNFPPSVAYGFPIGGKRMELGLMCRMGQAARMGATVRAPANKTVLQVWKRLKEEYPGFSSFFKGADIEYETVTALSNARMVPELIPMPGLVLIGDSAGFIDPFGSSGIYSGMSMAVFWATMLAAEIQKQAEGRQGPHRPEEMWRPGKIRKYHKAFRKTRIFRKIHRSYFLMGQFEWYVFRHLRTQRRINNRWPLISWLLRRAG